MMLFRNLNKWGFYLCMLSFFFMGNVLLSQTNHLSQRITVSFTNIPLEAGLKKLSDAGGFTFSYNSFSINGDSITSLSVQDKTVEKALNVLFDRSIKYTVVGNHVVLMKNTSNTNADAKKKQAEYKITGYIIDSNTGRKIREAIVYEIDGQMVSISDTEGFYTIALPAGNELRGLSYSKKGFLDTVVLIHPLERQNLDIFLRPLPEDFFKITVQPIDLQLADIHNRQLVNSLVPRESKVISDNLRIGEPRFAQFSFLPYLGTNRKISGSVYNVFSFNLLAGYSGGVKGFELGGLFNIDRNEVQGIQVAGFGNIVGGTTRWLQLGGFFNTNMGSMTGVQIAGFSNVVLNDLSGLQLAGFQNTLHGEMKGVQLSGFNNVTTQNVDGIQLTGFANIAMKDVKTAQISGAFNLSENVGGMQITGLANVAKGDIGLAQLAGFLNYARSINGMQASGGLNITKNKNTGVQLGGLLNYAKSGEGVQIAGFSNISAQNFSGFQIAGFFNYAKKMNGTQIAVINVCDTIENGMPIGIFSFVKKGYHKVEMAADEVSGHITYKTGIRKFYNIFRVGYGTKDVIYGGLGFGKLFYVSERLDISLDIHSTILFGEKRMNYLGILYKLVSTLDVKLGNRFTLYAGPTLNVLTYPVGKNEEITRQIAPYSIYENTSLNTRIQAWVGGTTGIRF